tara:strand:+ start:4316 stop:4918 length:603 start_codon:yes stop_codon:yes gene_type:complete
MALSDLLNVLVKNYVRRPTPTLKQDELGPYVQNQLSEIESTMATLADAALTVSDQEPESKRKGMVRYAVSPWDPLGDGTTGLVVYGGSSWTAVGGSSSAPAPINASVVDLGDWELSQSGSDLKFAYAGTDRFSLSSTGALTGVASITGPTTNATTVDLGAWTITQSGSDLKFAYNGTNRFKLESNGHMTVENNVTAYGSA